MKAALYVVELLIVACLVLVANYFWPVTQPDADTTRTVLLELGEMLVYFAVALALFYAARLLRAKAAAQAVNTAVQQQYLEHMCYVHEAQYGNRCTVDPRGPAPVAPRVVEPVRK